MHGTIMLLLFATPLFFVFGNVVTPDLVDWMLICSTISNVRDLLVPVLLLITASGSDAQRRRLLLLVRYTPCSPMPSYWCRISVRAVVLMACDMAAGTGLLRRRSITTIDACPGMTMFRMPIFVGNTRLWLLVLIAFPILGRRPAVAAGRPPARAHVFDTVHGGPSGGSTCSGSSATPRSTSSRCRSSASSARSCRSSAASRSSATSAAGATLGIAILFVAGVGPPHVRDRRRGPHLEALPCSLLRRCA